MTVYGVLRAYVLHMQDVIKHCRSSPFSVDMQCWAIIVVSYLMFANQLSSIWYPSIFCFQQLKYLFCLLVLVVTACLRHCTAQRKSPVNCINKELVKENADYKLRDDELKRIIEIVDRVVMKEPVKSHITEEQKQILWEIKDTMGKWLSADVTNDTVQKIMRAITDQGVRCTKEVGS